MTNNIILKRAALLLILFFLVFFSLLWLIHYLTFGKIIVTTSNPVDSIVLSATSGVNTSNKSFSKKATGSLSTSLKAGGYLVSVQNGTNGTSQYVQVKAHSTKRLSITLPTIVGVEPVIFDGAQDVAADSSRLVYLGTSNSSLNVINNQNQISQIDFSSYGFKSIQWADTTYGVAQNTLGQLFVINNTSVQPLQSPVSGQNDTSLVYAVAPNRNIYIGLGTSVYSGKETTGFKKIYSSLTSSSHLIPGLNMVGIINSGYSTGGATSTPSLTAISASGKQVSVKFNTPLNAWSSWSEHDKYVAVLGASAGDVFDSSLHKVATIPEANFTNAVWLDDNTLLYSVNGQLWSYNLQNQVSKLIADMPLDDTIQQLTLSADKSYVYLTTTDSTNGVAVRRVGLQNQKVPAYIYQLQDILPQSTPGAGYGLSLVNFSGPPTILVSRAAGGPSNLQQVATQDLQSLGIDVSQLQFEVVQAEE